MTENEWASLLDTLTEAWTQISIQLKDLAKAISDMFPYSNELLQFEELSKAMLDAFSSNNEVRVNTYMPPRKRHHPPKRINCTYSVERQVQRNLPYQRRNY